MLSFEQRRRHEVVGIEEEDEEKQPYVDLAHMNDPYDDQTILKNSSSSFSFSTVDLLLHHVRTIQATLLKSLGPLGTKPQRHIELPRSPQLHAGSANQRWRRASLSHFVDIIRCAMLFLLPSFVRTRYFEKEKFIPHKPHPTAWLDGIRGLAALFVFIFHMSNNVFDMWHGYGSTVDGQDYFSILRLPIVKVFYAGPAAVSVFFVVSGFALSLKPLKQIRAGQSASLMQTISSSTFRRPIRLFLPCYICSMMIILMARMGAYEATREFAASSDILTGKHKYHFRMAETLSEDLWRWGTQAVGMWQVFDWNELMFYNEFDTHFWTIPVEFRASLALFLTQVALARLRSWLRIIITLFFVVMGVFANRWEMVLFWGGSILAEFHLIANGRRSSDPTGGELGGHTHAPGQRRWPSVDTIFWMVNIISSLYLISYPDRDGAITPGYRHLTKLIPDTYIYHKPRFWQGMGGLQLVLCASHFEPLKQQFMRPIINYLGKISFALYLVHGTVNHLCGYAIFVTVYNIVGHEPGFQKIFGFMVGATLNAACVFWAADVFWRSVDGPCVKLGKWIEEKCLSNLWR